MNFVVLLEKTFANDDLLATVEKAVIKLFQNDEFFPGIKDCQIQILEKFWLVVTGIEINNYLYICLVYDSLNQYTVVRSESNRILFNTPSSETHFLKIELDDRLSYDMIQS